MPARGPITLATTCGLALLLALCAVALAAPGSLTRVEEDRDPSSGGSAEGLDGVEGVAVSPDGAHVYVASNEDDAVVTFSRSPATGALTRVEEDRDPENATPGTAQGLGLAHSVAVSPDGKHVYVTGAGDRTVVTFSRDASTGALTRVEEDRDPSDGGTAEGLDGARQVEVSPDGKHVYVVAHEDDTVVTFSRDAGTGALTRVEEDRDPGNATPGSVEGLDGALGLGVAPGGAHVYVAADVDDAVVTFSRNASTGALALVEEDRDPSSGGSAEGLDGARDAAVAPDGAHVYVAAADDDAIVTFSRDAGTGALTRVEEDRDPSSGGTAEGLDAARYVEVSPDGRNVYAVGNDDDALVTFSRNPVTGALTRVEEERDPPSGSAEGLRGAAGVATAPDGGRHVYVGSEVDDAVVSFARESPFAGTNGRIAFDTDRDGDREIFTMNADGSGELRLTDNTDRDGVPSFSRDGTRIVFFSDREGNRDIYVMNADGSDQTRLTTDPAFDEDPVFSADGTEIYFESFRDGNWNVYAMDANGDNEVPLTSDPGFDSDPVASPDGTKIVFSTDRNDPGFDIWTMDTDGSDEAELAAAPGTGESDAVFSRDGNQIFFASTVGGNTDIARMPAGGGAAVRLTTHPGVDRKPSVAPDGRFVAFQSTRDGNEEIYVMSAGGSGQENVTEDGGADRNPTWQSVTPAGEGPPDVPSTPPGDEPPDGAPGDGAPPLPPTPLPPGLDCTSATTLLVSCDDPAGAPGFCNVTIALFSQCQRPNAPPVTCSDSTPIICRPREPGVVTACGSFGMALPECNVPTRAVPGLCVPQGLGGGAPICGVEADPVTVCPRPSVNVTPACGFPTTVTPVPNRGFGNPRAVVAQQRRRGARPHLRVTIGCPRLNAVRRRCRGRVVVGGLRTTMLSALANHAKGTAGVYEFFVPGAQPYAAPFRAAAATVAGQALGGTKVPAAVDVEAVVRALGRDDRLTRAYADHLRRAVNEYRALALQRRPAPGSTRAKAAQTTRRTATAKPFRLRAGRRRATIPIRLSPAAIRRLVRDAGRRSRVPVRVLVVFDAEPQEVVRFVDLALRITRR